MLKVKICGITNLQDALMACEAGADALGFVFYKKSPRYIEPKKAKEIVSKLPPFVKRVALFVNETPEFINETLKDTHMDIAQLHFEVCEDFLKKLKCPYIRVVRAKTQKDIKDIDKNEYVLVDAFVESYGGAGKRVRLEWFDDMDCSKMILAGGLDENNIQEIKGYGFYGADVSSGVELYKGKKEHKKVENFIRLAKNL